MRFTKPPMALPALAYIATYQIDREKEGGVKSASAILKELGETYHAETAGETGVTVGLDSFEVYAAGSEEDDHRVFLLTLTPKTKTAPPNYVEEQGVYGPYITRFAEHLPENPVSIFTLHVRHVTSSEQVAAVLQRYLGRDGSRVRSSGTVNGCLLATLHDEAFTVSETLGREIITLPCHQDLEQAKRLFWQVLGDMTSLASHAGRLNRLRLTHESMIKQIDASERSTQFRINEIFTAVRRPLEQVKPKESEGMLREVTTLFSSLSILASATRRDYVKAQSVLRSVRGLFDSWNEQNFAQYPTNSSAEMGLYENTVAPLEDFTERVDALIAQLNTVFDALRTSVSIRQQKQNSQTLELQLRILNSIEEHEGLLKELTWAVVILTIMLVLLEIGRALHLLP